MLIGLLTFAKVVIAFTTCLLETFARVCSYVDFILRLVDLCKEWGAPIGALPVLEASLFYPLHL
jgi:hypothetical protein